MPKLGLNSAPAIAADTVLVFTMLRHHGEAIEWGLQAIEAHPNLSIGYRWLGAAYRNIEQFDEATTQLSRAVELDRNPPNVALLAEI